jgi:hypothetical protein
MIIVTNLNFSSHEIDLHKFSNDYDGNQTADGTNYTTIYSKYVNNTLLNPLPFIDFMIRPNTPEVLDIFISIWIIGKTEKENIKP